MIKASNYQEMMSDFENGIYDFTKNGKCIQCGSCCSNFLVMTAEEIETIHKYIKKYNIKEHRHILPLAEPTLDMTCPFLNDSKPNEKCDIYEVRPRVCRDFICDPKQRQPVDAEYCMKCKSVFVREEFFGKD